MGSNGELAPVDYAIVTFPRSRFTGQILPALTELVDSGTIRILDIVFVEKDAGGNVSEVEMLDLEPEARQGLERAGISARELFNHEDLEATAEELMPGSSAALIVWENLWASRIAQAARESGGELLDFGRLPHEVVQAAHDVAVAARKES